MSVILEEMRGPKSPIYPSHLLTYEDCPRQFLWKYGWEGIDLGDGPGRRKPVPGEKDQHHALMGTVIQRALEDFYNDKMWRNISTLEKDLHDKVKHYMLEYKDRFVLVNAPSLFEMNQVCTQGVTNFLKTAKAHRLVSNDARSEVGMKAWKNGLFLGAKIDFIIPKKSELILLDGKNSKQKMKYLSADQLRFYSMVYESVHGKRPDRIGYIWYRFPYDESTGEQGIDWVSCTDRDLKELEERIQSALKGMLNERFHPTPKPAICKWCDYETVCPERQEQRKTNSAKRTKSQKSLPILPTGFFSMGEE